MSGSIAKHPKLDQWIAIGADGRITVRTGKVDIGQRISTALATIAAEELDVDPARIEVARAETGVAPDEGITSGSNSMEESGTAVRLAAATARRHLLSLAAQALGVAPGTLEVADGLVRARETNQSTTYWELFGDRRFDIPVDPDVPVKSASDYRRIGRPAPARFIEAIVTGQPHFIHDMSLAGMLDARVVRPPHYRATLKALDDRVTGRLAESGIRLVRDGSFLAVAGADEYATLKAAERLAASAEWDTGGGLEAQDVFERLTANERISLPVVDGVPRKEPVPPLGDPPAAAAVTVEARYERPYHMHASIGPSAAVALWQDGKLTVWTHSQGIYVLRASMAEALGLAPDSVRLIHVPGAGCYGHNGADDAAFDAALVARAVPGTPVLLKWTREDEHAWEPYGSAMAMELRASLDATGAVIDWSHETWSDTYGMRPRAGSGAAGLRRAEAASAAQAGPARLLATRFLAEPIAPYVAPPSMGSHAGIHRNLDPLYAFPATRLVKNLVRGLPLRTSALRTLGAYGNIFAIESFMDELAEAAGDDPVAFRLRHLEDPRARAVIEAAAEALGWESAGAADGAGRGIGFAQYKNAMSYCAVAVELAVTDAAEVKLRRAVIAADSGQVVDPAGLTAQMEGGFLQAASWTLYEAVAFDGGGVTSRDWESYPILRFDNVPAIETVLMDRPGEPWLGAGEAAAGPTAGAIANAIAHATGLRLRRIPFTPDAIRAAAMAG